VIIREQRQRRIGNRGFWGRYSHVICGVKAVRRCGIGGVEKQRVEEQKE